LVIGENRAVTLKNSKSPVLIDECYRGKMVAVQSDVRSPLGDRIAI
jgi:hypothetical protein